MAEFEHLCGLGVFGGIDREHERFELIGGEIVPMNAKGIWHETLKVDLNRYWSKTLSGDVAMAQATTLHLDAHQFLEPDFFFWPSAVSLADIACTKSLLIVEVADSSFAYAAGRKAALYAGFGARDYWVINARTRATTIHRDPASEGFKTIVTHAPDATLVPALLPALAIRLADLPAR